MSTPNGHATTPSKPVHDGNGETEPGHREAHSVALGAILELMAELEDALTSLGEATGEDVMPEKLLLDEIRNICWATHQ